MIRRYLEFKGYDVRHVMNFTDVDDKIINRSRETGQNAMDLAEHYIERYRGAHGGSECPAAGCAPPRLQHD